MDKKHAWIAEVLADIGDYCDRNGLFELRGEITRAELVFYVPSPVGVTSREERELEGPGIV